MLVEVYLRNIERYNRPSNSDIDRHIKKVSKELICTFKTSQVPQVGDVIYVNELDGRYTVVQRVYCIYSNLVNRVADLDAEGYYMLAVVPFVGQKVYTYGSNSWVEDIRPICDIPEMDG